ncbi:uncharacterized protein C18orf25 homolog isoform X2 [Trichomycterus rosablanca]|uniref:uncharacterized protein C18orf25 homolog isoform X2 n=1 Tax=Trichomycterus rosablanca TaxID=2290929 RepID=UPI002F35693C
MADGQTASELPECPTEGAEDQDVHAKPEVPSSSSSVTEEPSSSQSSSKQPSPGLLSMPCLLQELRRDSSAEPLPPETSTTPAVAQLRPQEDSDSSACLRSPSSSGHLGDSDTLSSAEGEDVELVDTDLAPSSQTDPLTAPRKSSRRLRSESDASAGLGMAAKKNRCQERQANGGKVRARGQRSQRQKERMRLLRQKREAVAKRKPRLLQDSSTSDSDATAQSSSTDSSDNEGDTVLHPPAGRCGNGMGGVLEEALTRVVAVQRRTEERFRAWMERFSRLHSDDDGGDADGRPYGRNPEGRGHVGSQGAQTAYRILQLNEDNAPPPLNSAHSCVLDPNLLNV